MTTSEYKALIEKQINDITSNITRDGNGDLFDSSVQEKVAIAYERHFKLPVLEGLSKADSDQHLLTNWIYCQYYQNRAKTNNAPNEVNNLFFPFKEMLAEECFWRNRFWRYDANVQQRERAVLSRGYETRIVVEQQFVEDELVFEKGDPNDPAIINYLSMVFPKFEVQTEEKFLFGKQPLDNDGQGGIIRFYFHLNPDLLITSLPLITSALSGCLNERLIPFQIKFWAKSENFVRADNMVLYLERRHFAVVAFIIKHLYHIIQPYLVKDTLPLFVRHVLPGIGFAQSPQKEDLSFGVHRSQKIAQAILDTLNGVSQKTPLQQLGLEWRGVENFYLNATNTSAEFDFEIFGQTTDFLNNTHFNRIFMAAWYIAQLLCREAIWTAKGRCNWMNYQKIGTADADLGYQLLRVDNGFGGIEGVIKFLEAFSKIGLKDSILTYVLQSAQNYWNDHKQTAKIHQRVKIFISAKLISKMPENILVQPKGFSNPQFRNEVEKIIQGLAEPIFAEDSILKRVMEEHILKERPIHNMIFTPSVEGGSDDFCADMKNGLAAYGYALLRIYDPNTFLPLIRFSAFELIGGLGAQ